VNVPLPSGTNILSVVTQDSNSNVIPKQFSTVTSSSTPTALTYDANGNTLTDEKGYAYTWDALNRLISVTYPSGASTLFAYDGLSRRISIIEKDASNTVTSTKLYLWIGSEIAEERDASNMVTKRFFPQGEQQSGTAYFYFRDHLGSVREMCGSSGAIVARYSYDPYGRTTLVSGTNLATKQYAGMYAHQTSGLYLTNAGDGSSTGRLYDSNTGRWQSRDPIGERGGLNLFSYVMENPITHTDGLGLQSEPSPRPYPPPSPPTVPTTPEPKPPGWLDYGPQKLIVGPTCLEMAQQIYWNACQRCAEIHDLDLELDQLMHRTTNLSGYWKCEEEAGENYQKNISQCCYYLSHPGKREVLQP